jgi:ligand-binding SRPBCC domain-containing protein
MARIELTTHVDAPVERVFDLSLSIDLHIRSMSRSRERAVGGVTSGQIGLGQEVTWRARHFGITWTMTSRITDLRRPSRFVDEQVRGPFRRFRHIHTFREGGGGTDMLDVVTFDAPAEPLSSPFIAPYLSRLLERRNREIRSWAQRDDS